MRNIKTMSNEEFINYLVSIELGLEALSTEELEEIKNQISHRELSGVLERILGKIDDILLDRKNEYDSEDTPDYPPVEPPSFTP